MNRGPVALFGAIVAVGLGPAMWLGVQLGGIEVNPSRPPAVVGEPGAVPDRLVGGSAADTTTAAVIDATPQSEVAPRTHSATPSPSATTPAPTTAPTSSPTAEPSRSSGPPTPPTESTPTTPATDATSSSPALPAPPASPSSGAAKAKTTVSAGAING
jgi:hypothetical protein